MSIGQWSHLLGSQRPISLARLLLIVPEFVESEIEIPAVPDRNPPNAGEKNMRNPDGYTFALNGDVTRTPVRYLNRYGIEIAADLYVPNNASGKLPALAVSGPFGAVKEQAA
jgi:hypothetical protein